MSHSCSGPAVDGVVRLLLWAGVRVASSAVRDEQADSLVAAVGNGRGSAAGPVDTGFGERRAVVATAGQWQADPPRPGGCWQRSRPEGSPSTGPTLLRGLIKAGRKIWRPRDLGRGSVPVAVDGSNYLAARGLTTTRPLIRKELRVPRVRR